MAASSVRSLLEKNALFAYLSSLPRNEDPQSNATQSLVTVSSKHALYVWANETGKLYSIALSDITSTNYQV